MLEHGGMYDIAAGLTCDACTWSKRCSERCPACGVPTLVSTGSDARDEQTCAVCEWTGSLRDVSIHGES